MSARKFDLILCEGVEGKSVYLNDYRIAGPKPWGGGKVLQAWKVSADDIQMSGVLSRRTRKQDEGETVKCH